MQTQSTLPPIYRALGLAGLLPFVAGPALISSGNAPLAALLFPLYSLAIACFLCGVWWGIAVGRGLRGVAVAVASNAILLLAVGAVIFGAPSTAIGVLALVFLIILVGDLTLPALATPFTGYRGLRVQLTVLVIAAHGAMLALL